MALIKNIELDNGIVLNYHRIASITKITNVNNIIEILSYCNSEQRIKEKNLNELEIKNQNGELTDVEKVQFEKGINLYVNTEYITTPYDDLMTIENAYNYLKTTDKYQYAESDNYK